ncbi:hypothetical protein [Paractinoplanes rishiriensis]|uniref:hypothetical protein n=1 Tax=Paractinoplanes rishiriensis TaxID=1050105 RepID=UPI001942399E|nr:hypothetical protein [Actinoplanes rishiriensis]
MGKTPPEKTPPEKAPPERTPPGKRFAIDEGATKIPAVPPKPVAAAKRPWFPARPVAGDPAARPLNLTRGAQNAPITQPVDVTSAVVTGTQQDIRDIGAIRSSHAPGVANALTNELTALQNNRRTMTDAEWEAAVQAFSTKVNEIKGLFPEVRTFINDRPLQRAKLLAMLMNVTDPFGAARVRQKLQELRVRAAEESGDIVTEIEGATKAELDNLEFDEKVRMLNTLRAGSLYRPETRRKAAIAKLYISLPLDTTFATRDRELRDRVLARLRTELHTENRNWTKMTPAQRIAALKRVIEIQCDEMGLPAGERPALRIIPNLTSKMPDGTVAKLSGRYVHGTRTIEVSDDSINKFDKSLETVIHENTHNYQHWLVKQLEDGTIGPNDPSYVQARLFLVNLGAYHQGYTKLLPPADDVAAYVGQPVERHAWKAGVEARRLFRRDARLQATELANQMRAFSAGDQATAAQQTQLAAFCQIIDRLLQEPNVTSTQLFMAVDVIGPQYRAMSAPRHVADQDDVELTRLQLT